MTYPLHNATCSSDDEQNLRNIMANAAGWFGLEEGPSCLEGDVDALTRVEELLIALGYGPRLLEEFASREGLGEGARLTLDIVGMADRIAE